MKDTLDIKIFITAILLLELIDKTEGKSKFKHKLRHHLNGTVTQLERLLDVTIDSNNLSLLLTNACSELNTIINAEIKNTTPKTETSRAKL